MAGDSCMYSDGSPAYASFFGFLGVMGAMVFTGTFVLEQSPICRSDGRRLRHGQVVGGHLGDGRHATRVDDEVDHPRYVHTIRSNIALQ